MDVYSGVQGREGENGGADGTGEEAVTWQEGCASTDEAGSSDGALPSGLPSSPISPYFPSSLPQPSCQWYGCGQVGGDLREWERSLRVREWGDNANGGRREDGEEGDGAIGIPPQVAGREGTVVGRGVWISFHVVLIVPSVIYADALLH